MMRPIFISLVASVFCGQAWAGIEDSVPSCYDAKLGVTAAPVQTELFVLVDQTTLLDKTLQQQIADNIRPFMAPNNAFSVSTFSAFSQGRYAQVVTAGRIEPGISQEARDDISKPLLMKFDACAKRQPQIAMQAVGIALRAAFSGSSTDLAKSDVFASLKSISARVKASKAKNKLVLIASDMLENSSISSFYEKKGKAVRHIDAVSEFKNVVDNDLLADFDGARVFVIGAGILNDDTNRAAQYRDPKSMRALSSFWKMYFQKSHAIVVEIGQPALMNPISRSD